MAPHQLSHGVDIWTILSNDEVPQSVTCCVPMPLLYRVTCILADLQVVSMSTSCVVLACRVDPHHCLVRDHFRSLRLTRGSCPHNMTDRYLLKVAMDQWSCAVEGCKSVICLQAFVFVMEVVSCRPQNAAHVVTMTCTRSLNLSAVVLRLEPCLKILADWSFPSSLVLPWMLPMNAYYLSTRLLVAP